MIIYIAAVLALTVAAFYVWVEFVSLKPPKDAKNLYFPPRYPGVLGFFTQHLLNFYPQGFHPKDKNGGPKYGGDMLYQLEIAEQARQAGKKGIFVAFTVFGPRITLIEPKDVQHVLIGNASSYCKGPDPYKKLEFILGETNLVTMRDENMHTIHRKMLAPFFSQKMLAMIAEQVDSKHIAKLCDAIHKEYILNEDAKNNGSDILDHLYSQTALGIISESAFLETHVEDMDIGSEFEKLQAVGNGNFYLVHLPLWVRELGIRFSMQGRRVYKQAEYHLNNFRKAVDLMTASSKKRGAENQRSVVDTLVHQKEVPLTPEMIQSHGVTMLAAGFETTKSAISWSTYLLAWNPRVQDVLFDELQEVVHPTAVPNLDDIKDLPYLNAVVKEALRYRPPVPSVVRLALKDDTLPSGLKIEAGDRLVISPLMMHHNPSIYDNPEQFRPERWINEEEAARIKENGGMCGFMPFLKGKRVCIGEQFAINEVLMVLATVVRRYKIEKADPNDLFPFVTHAVTIRPLTSKKLKLIPRTD